MKIDIRNSLLFIGLTILFLVLAYFIKDQWDSDWKFTCGWAASSIYYSLKRK